ncbi:antichymotrypsin-2-like isoform X3 [Pararge aegeria]|uniref:Jg2896 protein n=1 Tax=Pararge aegeria aegeria TaxID=348720 RepID=A0A8S4SKF1_9NEOP|nr:antichymotrypsin-2-like isoform X3 [Pararge aegeria]CAH2267161.1 jg2896 [Pararge aegeria aegeria]
MWIRTAFCISVLYASVQTVSSNMDSKALSSSIAQFSARFCNELDKTKNVVSSPLSAEFVLALVALGSEGDAHSELLTGLGIPDDDAIRFAFSTVSQKLKAVKGVTLNVANKVYVKEGDYDLNEQLKNDAIKVFDAGLEKLNFDNGAAAAKLINQWVESKTNNKIKELLTSDCLNEDTRLVLVNALYFKGQWSKQFDRNNTSDQPFYINEETTVDVPMMYREDDYWYGESQELGVQLLRISYVGNEASMLILLPNEITGLDTVLKKLAEGYDLLAELDKMYNTKVQVSIPKFKIETEIDLGEVLPKLGIKSIFNRGNSGLSKILNKPEEIYVSKAVQKAFIEVNEEGAEATAATAMGIMTFSAMLDAEPVPSFNADHPFIAAVVADNTIYFTATFYGK